MATVTDLRPSDDQFRLLVESVEDYAIYFVDLDGTVRSWNLGAHRLKGYDADEIVGRNFSVFYTPEARAAHEPERNLERAKTEGHIVDVGWRVKKDGTRFWASIVITAIHDERNKHIGYAKVTRDLTDASYRAFVEATNAILWTTDANGKPNADSPTWRAFTGQSEAEWLGQRAWDAVHKDDLARMQEAWSTAKRERRTFEAEFRMRREDGVYVWMSARALPLTDGAGGGVREWFGVTFDISARKRAELEVESRLSWWTTTLTSIGDAVVATDERGHVQFLNPVAERLLDVRADDVVGRPLSEVFVIVNETTRAPVDSPVRKVLEHGVIVGLANHTVLIRTDGTEIPIDDSAAPIRTKDGSLVGVVLVFRDVTREKIAEVRRDFLAHANEELLRTESYRDALAVVARLAVPRLADWIAVEIREPGVVKSDQVVVAHVDPEKVQFARRLNEQYPPDPNAKTGVPEVLRSGKSELYARLDLALLEASARDDEHRRIIRELKLRSAMIVPLRANDRVIGAITFIFAESGRAYDEDDLAFAEDFANRAALVVERRKAEAEAVAANRTKDEFLATLSHELRTPLQAILGWATMLKRGTVRDPQRAIDTIVRNATAQARLIDDILDVARIVSGKLTLSMRSVPFGNIVVTAVEAMRPTAAARKIELRVHGSGDVGFVEGDPDRLQQVVANLLQNAVKFTDAGGAVDVTISKSDGNIVLSVKDTGRGIPREHLPHIFERFRQVEGGSTREKGGLGLGLAIVHHLVEAHRGRVAAASDGLGKGATFTVTLPASTPRALAISAITPVPAFTDALKGIRVLIVDDDDDSRELVGEALMHAGADVTRAASVPDAFAAFSKAPPHVLVTDLGLPREDGYSLLARVRALPPEQGRDTPVVALTAFATSDDTKRSAEAGFDLHLTKPVDPEILINAVRSLTAA